jgi:hypothetical protein
MYRVPLSHESGPKQTHRSISDLLFSRSFPFPLPSQFLELGLALSTFPVFIDIMLSTLRVASRSAAARDANMRTVVIGARQASAWSKVPQGPPVSLK